MRPVEMGPLLLQDDVQTATMLLLGLKSHAKFLESKEEHFSTSNSVDAPESLVEDVSIKKDRDEAEQEEVAYEYSPVNLAVSAKRELGESSSSRAKVRKSGDAGSSSSPKRPKSKSKSRRKSSQPLSPDTNVACKVKDEDSGDAVWILGRIVQYYPESKKYKILDVGDSEEIDQMEETSRTPRVHKLSRSLIRMLPEKPNLDLGSKTRALAVYPNTTVFYPATVRISARRQGGHEYTLEFDDEEEPGETCWKRVPANYVLPLEEIS